MLIAPARATDAALAPSVGSAADVAVIGGGASGVLTALHLLAGAGERDLAIDVHEATGVLGRGIAYGTSDPRHLLNVRARHMSAYADIPSDLLDWARRAGRDPDPLGFLPRQEFAGYLQDTLAAAADDRLTIRAGRVEDVEALPDGGFALRTRDRVTTAQTVVLAYGNQPPAPLVVDGTDLATLPGAITNPWDLGAIRTLPADATVVLVGTGLTAVDVAITLLEDEPRRRAVMVSRHGWLPKAHIAQQSTGWVSQPPDGELTADGLADFVRGQVAAARTHGVDWHNVIDGLRPVTQSVWLRLDLAQRRRFLAEYARTWEIHRHRMAPEVAARLDRYRREGRLRIAAGGLTGLDARGGLIHARLQGGLQGGLHGELHGEEAAVRCHGVVNCTGPLPDLTGTADPLLRALLHRGLIAPDPLRLSLDSTPEGGVLDSRGAVVPGLFAVGPPRKGALWESTAIPEIRAQAAALARTILAGLPVAA